MVNEADQNENSLNYHELMLQKFLSKYEKEQDDAYQTELKNQRVSKFDDAQKNLVQKMRSAFVQYLEWRHQWKEAKKVNPNWGPDCKKVQELIDQGKEVKEALAKIKPNVQQFKTFVDWLRKQVDSTIKAIPKAKK